MATAIVRHHGPVAPARTTSVRDSRTAVAVATAVLVALSGATVGAGFDQLDHSAATGLVNAFVIGTVAVVGAAITLAVPGNRVGWLLLAAAVAMGSGEACTEAGVHGLLTAPGSVPAAGYLAAVGPALRGLGWVLVVLAVPLVFPDGRLPGVRWRWLAWCLVGAGVGLFLGAVLSPHGQETRLTGWHNPLGLPERAAPVADLLSLSGLLFAVVCAVGAVTGLVARWRRDGPLVRQQLLLLALAACPPVLLVLWSVLVSPQPRWAFALAVLPFPVAIAVATLAFGLYDLRRATHRTLLWLTMSASVLAVYALVVLAVAALVPDHRSGWPSAVAAVVAALALVPLRQALQRAVNRVVYGRWHEPYDVLSGLGESLAATADVDLLVTATVHELTAGLGLRDVSVRDLAEGATADAAVSNIATLPLQAYGGPVGWLSYRLPDRPLSPAEDRLLHDLARHLGGVLHARGLHRDLQRARERLVLAREEERRRLRRDLHDGIGPALAGLTLKAETARVLLPPGADATARQLQALSEEIRRTVVDVRRVVEGLRPPALDELGLAAACRQAVDRLTAGADLRVTVDTPHDLPALPAAGEVAAYRIMIEAVTNVVRHACARNCQVTLGLSSGALLVTVDDDGHGLATEHAKGNGLYIMRERAEEIGGTIVVSDALPGVRVRARLPVAMSQPSAVLV